MFVNMRELVLDGKNWTARDDVYDSFFAAVGAPSWHGRNFEALHDSTVTGNINKIEVPYSVKIKNHRLIGPGARKTADDFVDLLKEFRDEGCPVDIQVEN
jgi:RNAse (barnase) inhibitor barstar